MAAVEDLKLLPRGTRIAGYQTWSKLTFLHWRVAADALQPLVPEGLIIDEFDNTAWLGFVPFAMEKIRPWWSPAVPGISWFLETNVRTYVRHPDGTAGVWFFSLDANSRLAVTIARKLWMLPYFVCDMALDCRQEKESGATTKLAGCRYHGTRQGDVGLEYDLDVRLPPSNCPITAVSNSLEHFLLERYVLFADAGDGRLFRGDVHHCPYRFRPAIVHSFHQTLTASCGLNLALGPDPDHSAFCDGVDVIVSPLQRCRLH